MKKRYLLQAGVVIMGAAWLSRFLGRDAEDGAMAEEQFEFTKTNAECRNVLTPAQFYVLRQQGTEVPFTSPLNKQHGKGTYVCAACALPLFKSDTKYNSGTGWPSFYAAIPGATATSVDKALFMTRTEVHCHRCGGHLGHVFDDGPPPTGKRYCMNGVALKFVPA